MERAADQVLDGCVDLDPIDPPSRRRSSDGRSVWVEPVAAQFTSEAILAEEERILTWALDVHTDQPAASPTVTTTGLDVLQADAAAAVEAQLAAQGEAGAGGVHPQFARGVAIGRSMADVMRAWALADGISRPWNGVPLPTGPGLWVGGAGCGTGGFPAADGAAVLPHLDGPVPVVPTAHLRDRGVRRRGGRGAPGDGRARTA